MFPNAEYYRRPPPRSLRCRRLRPLSRRMRRCACPYPVSASSRACCIAAHTSRGLRGGACGSGACGPACATSPSPSPPSPPPPPGVVPRTAEGGADIATIAPQHTQGATASKPVGRWNASSSARTAALELIDPARARSGASVSIPHAAQRTAPSEASTRDFDAPGKRSRCAGRSRATAARHKSGWSARARHAVESAAQRHSVHGAKYFAISKSGTSTLYGGASAILAKAQASLRIGPSQFFLTWILCVFFEKCCFQLIRNYTFGKRRREC